MGTVPNNYLYPAVVDFGGRRSFSSPSNSISNDRRKETIEFFTGKKVRVVMADMCRNAIRILFEDGSEGLLGEGESLERIQIIPKTKYYCLSCGKEAHSVPLDYAGRCTETLKNLWNNARKVYWHRYSKNKS